jgi:hypothetical protein
VVAVFDAVGEPAATKERSMTSVARKEVERLAMVDYLQFAGKVVLATEIECYDDRDNSVTALCDPPAVVRIASYRTCANAPARPRQRLAGGEGATRVSAY